MEALTLRERELVALGAALASNCLPCIEHHIPAARRAGLNDQEIGTAIALADQIRQVPAGNVLAAAQQAIARADGPQPAAACADLKPTACC
jgi:4-carboxymuconolactone decarboxylase